MTEPITPERLAGAIKRRLWLASPTLQNKATVKEVDRIAYSLGDLFADQTAEVDRLRAHVADERAKIEAASRWLDEDEAQARKPVSHWHGCTAPGGGECTCTRDLGTWNRSRLNRIAERRAALTTEPETDRG